MGFGWLEVGYSGVTFPLVEPCLTHAAKLGYKRIIVFPYFLFTGILIDRIYGFTDQVAAANPDIQFIKAPYLNDHAQVLETFAERAARIGNIRSAAAVELWADHLDGAVVAIGNAPTALFHLLTLIANGAPKPSVILGFPVGFVGADGMAGLAPATRAVVEAAEVIIGGERHHDLSADLAADRIAWPSPFNALIDILRDLKGCRVVVLATGDPL
jgi:hypothetical protein